MGKRTSRRQEYDSGAIAPTLVNNARMGHPRFFRGDIKKDRNGGPPAHDLHSSSPVVPLGDVR
jgi:hypothetical protein